MDEYVDRFALRDALYDADAITMLGIKIINQFQTAADVAPVVMCKDCKHHYFEQEPCHGKSVHYCEFPHMRGIEVFKEFFCYYGERKEGADNV